MMTGKQILFLFFFLAAWFTTYRSSAQDKQKHTWMEIQEGKIHALKEYKQLENIKDSISQKNGEALTLSVEREPCDICSKWDLVLYNSKKQYLAFYVIKFKKKNNQIASVTKLKIKNK